jgi:hypothetical protein
MLCRTAGEHPYRTATPPTALEPEMPFDGAIYTIERGTLVVRDTSGRILRMERAPVPRRFLYGWTRPAHHRTPGSFGGRCWPPKTVVVETTILKADVMNANGDVFPAEALRPLGWPLHWGTPPERRVSWWRRLWRWIREG